MATQAEVGEGETVTSPEEISSQPLSPMNAVVIGGTGATGKCLVGLLLKEKTKFGKITVVGRRKLVTVDDSYSVNLQEEETNGRLVQVEQDLETIDDESIQRICTGAHVFFNCLGTTRRIAGSAERFHQIDHDIPLKFAKAAKAVGVPHVSQLSSWGAKANSMFLYLRTKGELDEALVNLKFNITSIVRPKALDRGGDRRFLEKIAVFLSRALPVSTLAEAMAIDAYSKYTEQKQQPEGDESAVITTYLENPDIYRIVEESKINVEIASEIGSSVDPPKSESEPVGNEEPSNKPDDTPPQVEEDTPTVEATVNSQQQQEEDTVEVQGSESGVKDDSKDAEDVAETNENENENKDEEKQE